VKEETSAHILCECESLASLKTCVSGLLFLGAGGYQEHRLASRLELQ